MRISDVTDRVKKMKNDIDQNCFNYDELPLEKEYVVEENIKHLLGMK
jgi:hypothetical protein